MPLTRPFPLEKSFAHAISEKYPAPSPNAATPTYAISEINAYIAIRDELLAEAEQLRTRAKLDCVLIANDFVAGCLRPARKLYAAQSLPERDAVRERTRCAAVKNRVVELLSAAC